MAFEEYIGICKKMFYYIMELHYLEDEKKYMGLSSNRDSSSDSG